MTFRVQIPAAGVLSVAAFLAPRPAAAGSALVTAAVDEYPEGCNGPPSLEHATDGAYGFRLMMEGMSGRSYATLIHAENYDVYAGDLYDPDITGSPADDDDEIFDRIGVAFSYFQGHGDCTTVGDTTHTRYGPPQYCSSSSDCTNPPADSLFTIDAQLPGFCHYTPGDVGVDMWPVGSAMTPCATDDDCSNGKTCQMFYDGSYCDGGECDEYGACGTCSYTVMGRTALTATCSEDYHESKINYSSGDVKWGESVFANWSAAGTNGGTNVVLMVTSCAEMSNRGQEIWPAFAGMHALLDVLVHTGDTADNPYPGFYFAGEGYEAGASISGAWLDSANDIAGDGVHYCADSNGETPYYGSGAGINGCGGHIATAMGATEDEAVDHLNEDFVNVQFDTNDGLGNDYWASTWTCNYDCSTYPFYL